MWAGNVCGLVTATHGGRSKRGSSPCRVSRICYSFPPSANRSSPGPCRVRSSFRSGKATGRGSLSRSEHVAISPPPAGITMQDEDGLLAKLEGEDIVGLIITGRAGDDQAHDV